MEKLVDEGLVKHIGVSNLSTKKLADVLSYARVPCEVNQIEIHPYWRYGCPAGYDVTRSAVVIHHRNRRFACSKKMY